MMIRFLMTLFFTPVLLYGIATNNVAVDVQWNSIYENTPYTVTLSITHDAGDKIDPSSFTADKKKISPVFVKDVKISPSSPLEISIYTIEMPGLPQGLQTLPTFGVKIQGGIYTSVPTGFEVKGGTPYLNGSQGLKLTLQPLFTGTEPLYPGQRFDLGYRYLFNSNIDLSEEKLPLLEAKGFKKIGDKKFENGIDQGMSATQITQKVESQTPGNYIFEASNIVGYTYRLGAGGEKVYDTNPLSSALPPFQLKVLDFPIENKPTSFRGAIGSQLNFSVKLMDARQVLMGDKIQLLLTISGTGELESMLPPDLCCQPGFSGYFKQSDLPPETVLKNEVKTFLVDLYVENPDVATIPPIEFSYFNPLLRIYEKKLSEGIPFQVHSEHLIPLPKESLVPEGPSSSSSLSPLEPIRSFPYPLTLLLIGGLSFLVFQSDYCSLNR